MCVFIRQGKEEFEKNQRQLLEKGNIIRHKSQLEQQQVCVSPDLFCLSSSFVWHKNVDICDIYQQYNSISQTYILHEC